MLIVISPAKTLDFESEPVTKSYSQPQMLKDSEALMDVLSTKSPSDIEKLMGISPALAELNVERYHKWSRPFRPSNAKQAILAFRGDVYAGLEADKFKDEQFDYAQDHLRILSGLYGVLRPLDLIQPYRLEMGVKLKNPAGENIYDFWDEKLTKKINKQLKAIDSKILLNLASVEYFKSLKPKSIQAEIISPVFKDWKNGQYKMISFFAKKARGTMSAWVIKNQVEDPEQLIKFRSDGYRYSARETKDPMKPVFIRKQT
ncbi:MAG: peroxide stress protein YaaA [Pseudomonadota bacterium]